MSETKTQFDHEPRVTDSLTLLTGVERIFDGVDLSSPVARADFLRNATVQSIESVLLQINALSRGLAESEYDMGRLMTIATPELEDKQPLLQEAIDCAKIILDKGDPQESFILATLAISSILQDIHPFKDGNGRTSRLFTYLMVFGGEQEDYAEKLSSIVNSRTGGRLIYTVTPPEVRKQIFRELTEEYADNWSVTDQIRRYLSILSGDAPMYLDQSVVRYNDQGKVVYEPGQIDAKSLLLEDHFTLSEIYKP